MNTADFLLENGRDQDPVLLTPQAQFTYADLRDACRRLLGVLCQQGVQPGEPVGLTGANGLFWVAAYLAILKLGAVAVPYPTTAGIEELERMLQLTRVKVICADRSQTRKISARLPAGLKWIDESALQASVAPPAPTPGPTQWEDLDAAWMLTSGTTALPRVVRITHQNLQANTQSILAYLGLEHTDRIMVVLPFHYCFGTSLLHTHLRAGGSLALAPTFVYPEIVLNQIEETGCTGFAGVPSTYQTLLRNSTFPQRQIRSLRAIQQAGGKLENVLIHELRSSVPNGQVFVMYGQTEATARLSYLPPELLDSKMGSIGRGIPGVTLKVLQDDGQEAAPGQVGEIWAWGKNISPGYLDNPEATAQKFVSGALRTGDLATVDEEGYLFVVDRKADFIKSYGYRVSSQQIEACILELPEVVAAAVIGEADLARGEAILAFVVLREGAVLQADEVIAHCARHLARHMLPRDVWFIPRLPMNANGKVIKTELRKLAETTPEHQDPA